MPKHTTLHARTLHFTHMHTTLHGYTLHYTHMRAHTHICTLHNTHTHIPHTHSTQSVLDIDIQLERNKDGFTKIMNANTLS